LNGVLKSLPNYEYLCSNCDTIFEAKLPMVDYLLPEHSPCPECRENDCLHIYLSSPPALGDPIKLGITRPPDAFLHGVLGRMENSVPDKSTITPDGKIKRKFVNFSKARYSPGRLV